MSIRVLLVDDQQLVRTGFRMILADEEEHLGGLAFAADGRLIAKRSRGGLTIWDSKRKLLPVPDRR